MPESLNRCTSAGAMVSGRDSQGDDPIENGLSMSITSDRRISSIARAEYCVDDCANRRYRPRLIIGASATAAPALAAVVNHARRVLFTGAFSTRNSSGTPV
jgi:hypothetical protein